MQRKATAITISSLLLILLVTLFPFNFSLSRELFTVKIWNNFHHPTHPVDLLANVLLFIPFGFSCTCLIHRKRFRWKVLFTILGISMLLSLSIEVLQIFLPLRFSTKSDLVANTLGGLLGYLGFFLYYLSASLTRLRKTLKSKYLALCLIGYFSIIVWLTFPLLNATSLSNWNTNFPLLLGNEATGDRQWQGSIAQLSISDRALPVRNVQQFLMGRNFAFEVRDSLLASYTFSEQESLQNKTSQFPILAWQGEPGTYQTEGRVFFKQNNWLATPISPGSMIKRIRQTSEFTIFANIATTKLEQSGPARIVSLSKDKHHCNFMVGQEDDNLVFRIRNPLMGKNGANFKFFIPNVFTDTDEHRLAIVYGNSAVTIYIDKLNNIYFWQLMPEAALWKKLFYIQHSYSSMIEYKIIYYLFAFIPLGFLLALLSIVLKGSLIFRSLSIGGGFILPIGVLQGMLANGSSSINLTNFLLSIAIAVMTFLFVRRGIFLRMSSMFKSAQ